MIANKSLALAAKIGILKMRPEVWDAVIPHGHRAVAVREQMAASVIQEIGGKLSDRKLKGKLLDAGKAMLASAAQGLINGWDDGDPICPPWPWPGPGLGPFGPQPEPWKSSVIEQLTLADHIATVAGLTGNREIAGQFMDVAREIVAGAIKGLPAEFEMRS